MYIDRKKWLVSVDVKKMPKVYDDWERLVRAAVRKQELWQLFHDHSRTPSGSSAASGTTGGSPASAASPKPVRSRVSPFMSSHPHEVLPSSSTARVSPATRNHGPEKEKQMKRGKSRLRLDRWILTRWLSKTFHSTSS